jgi:hypothetical protein
MSGTILDKESNRITNQIASLARKLAIMTIEKIIDDGTILSKDVDVGKLIDEALKGSSDTGQCSAILVSGKNRGEQCSMKKTKLSDYCSRHTKIMEAKKTDQGKRKKNLEKIIFPEGEEETEELSYNHLGGELYLLDDPIAKIVLMQKEDKYVAVASLVENPKGAKNLALMSTKAKLLCKNKDIKIQSSLFKEASEAYSSLRA